MKIRFPRLGKGAKYKDSPLRSIMEILCIEAAGAGYKLNCQGLRCFECGLFHNNETISPEEMFYAALLNYIEEKDT